MTQILAAPFAALFMSSCGGLPEVQSNAAGLSVAYVSGHLGTASECPAADASKAAPSNGDAACQAPTNGGGGASGASRIQGCGTDRCANGAVLVELKNIALGHDVPVNVEKVELLEQTPNGEQASDLTLVEARSTQGQVVSTLSPAAKVTLRILFPQQSRFRGTTNTGRIRVTISGDNGAKVEIETPELQFVPAIAT